MLQHIWSPNTDRRRKSIVCCLVGILFVNNAANGSSQKKKPLEPNQTSIASAFFRIAALCPKAKNLRPTKFLATYTAQFHQFLGATRKEQVYRSATPLMRVLLSLPPSLTPWKRARPLFKAPFIFRVIFANVFQGTRRETPQVRISELP